MRDVSRALFALLVVLALPWQASADTGITPTAILLAARDALPDPSFRRSVVLVMNNLGSTPGGLIVNRPTRIPVSHLFPDVERLAHVDAKLYFGGPVDLTSVSFLFRAGTAPDDAIRVLEGVYLSRSRALLLELLGRDKPMEGLRIFVGYSGWAPGQLQAEIARGDWTLTPADAGGIFNAKPEHPWPELGAGDAGQRI